MGGPCAITMAVTGTRASWASSSARIPSSLALSIEPSSGVPDAEPPAAARPTGRAAMGASNWWVHETLPQVDFGTPYSVGLITRKRVSGPYPLIFPSNLVHFSLL